MTKEQIAIAGKYALDSPYAPGGRIVLLSQRDFARLLDERAALFEALAWAHKCLREGWPEDHPDLIPINLAISKAEAEK